MENYDDRHFVFNFDDGRCLDYEESSGLRFVPVISGVQKFIACLRLSGGLECRIEAPFVVFQNT